MITMDHAGRVIEFNPAAEEVFGLPAEDVKGKEMAELVIPPSCATAIARGSRQRGDRRGHVIGRRIELTGMRSDGTEFPVELAISARGHRAPDLHRHLRDISEVDRAR